MNNTSQKCLSLAKQGNIEAINTCLTYILRDLEITVRGSLKKTLIELILDKPDDIPAKEASVQYIKKFFYYLQIDGIDHVIIYAKQPVNNSLAWLSEFYIKESAAITNTETNTLTNIQASQNIVETLPTHIETENSQITPIAEILAPVNITAPDLPSQTGLLISQGAIASGSQMEALAEAKVAIDFQSNTSMVLDQAVTAGGIAFGVELAFSGLDNFLAVQRGEKSVEDALMDTLSDSANVAVTASVITGGVVALSLVFPPVAAVGCVAAPVLKIVGVAGGVQRLINILSNSGKVEGINQLAIFMASYGLDKTELDFMDMEADAELQQLKLGLT
jgi:hypothetical protein